MNFSLGDRIVYIGKDPWKIWERSPLPIITGQPRKFTIETGRVTGVIVRRDPRFGYDSCWNAEADDPKWALLGSNPLVNQLWCISDFDQGKFWAVLEKLPIEELLTSKYPQLRAEGRRLLEKEKQRTLLGRIASSLKNKTWI